MRAEDGNRTRMVWVEASPSAIEVHRLGEPTQGIEPCYLEYETRAIIQMCRQESLCRESNPVPIHTKDVLPARSRGVAAKPGSIPDLSGDTRACSITPHRVE